MYSNPHATDFAGFVGKIDFHFVGSLNSPIIGRSDNLAPSHFTGFAGSMESPIKLEFVDLALEKSSPPDGRGVDGLIPGYTLSALRLSEIAALENDFREHALGKKIKATAGAAASVRVRLIRQAIHDADTAFAYGSPAFNRAAGSAVGKCALLIRSIRRRHPKASVDQIVGVLDTLPRETVQAAVNFALGRSGEQRAGDSQGDDNAQADEGAGTAT